MRILDKYILKSFMGPFLFGVFAFTSIFVGTGTLFRIAQYITEYGASVWSVTKIFFLALPSIVVLTFPMSTLLGTLMTFGKLSGNSEIIVMRAGGQKFLRLALPIYVLAFFIAIGTTIFNEYVVPPANHEYQRILREEIKREAMPKNQSNIVLKQLEDGEMKALLYAGKYNSDKKELSRVTIQEFKDGNVVRVEHAENATWDGSQWIMHNGTMFDIVKNSGVSHTMNFISQKMPLLLAPSEVSKRKLDEEEMTIRELRSEIKAFEVSGANSSRLQMELYKRFTIPFASFLFALVGACLGLQPQRSSSSRGFGISVLIIFCYYGIMTFSEALGNGGAMPPIVAVAIPDTLVLIMGLYLNFKASK